MEKTIINDTYDRISKILKNDQQYAYAVIARRIVECLTALEDVNHYYETYPPLLDVAELGAALEYGSAAYQKETIRQIKYKMLELERLLPNIN